MAASSPSPADTQAPAPAQPLGRADRVLHRLFPVEGEGPWGPGGLVLALLAAGAAAVVQLARQAGLAPWHTMWAEDGSRFFSDARQLPFAETVLREIHGYLLVYPRALAGLSLLADPEWSAVVFAVAASGSAGLVAVTIYRAASGHIEQRFLRAVLAALVVLSPVAGKEVVNNLANLQWYLALAAFWLLVWRPASAAARVWQVAALAVAALSAPIAVVFTPLAALRVLAARRLPRELVAPVVFLAGIAAQVASVLLSYRGRGGSLEPVEAAHAFAQRVALVGLVGNDNAGRLWEGYGWAGPVAAVVLLAVLVLVAVARRSRVALPVVVTAGASVAFFALSGSGRAGAWQNAAWEAGGTHELLGRYLFVPVALVQAVVILSLDDRPAWVRARAWRVGGGLVALGLLAGSLGDFVATNPRDEGPVWRDDVQAAREECATSRDLDVVSIQVAPQEHDFPAHLPCDDL